MTKHIYFLLFFAAFLTACESKISKRLDSLNAQVTQINDSYKGKVLEYPKSKLANDQQNAADAFRVVVYYDADCSVCFEQLGLWKKEILDYTSVNHNVDFRFILKTSDQRGTKINLGLIQFPEENVTFVGDDVFQSKYDFVTDKALNVILLNSSDEILFAGSPLISRKIKEIYLNIISE